MSGTTVGTVPATFSFSQQDVTNVLGYNDLLACENNSDVGVFPGGIAYDNSLLHFHSYFRDVFLWPDTTMNTAVTICPYTEKRVLILQIGSTTTSVRPYSVPTLNGVAFTQAGNNAGTNRVEFWYMSMPPVGTYNLSITTNAKIGVLLCAIPYTGSISLYSTNFQSGTSATPTISATTPGTNSIIVTSMMITVGEVQYPYQGHGASNTYIEWQGTAAVYLGISEHYPSVGARVFSNPATISHVFSGPQMYQIASAVFSIP